MDDVSSPRRLMLPPPYTQHRLGAGEAAGDVMAAATARAPEEGAGTLVWRHATGGGTVGRLDFAVVLEPEQTLAEARGAFIAGMVALGDALAAHCPPDRPIRFGWPDEVFLDAGRLGGARLAVAPGCGEDSVPDWMVLGVELIADRDHLSRPGDFPDSVSLKEEAFVDPLAIVESFAAHLMLNFDRWRHEGFASVLARYAGRLAGGATLTDAGDLRLDDDAPRRLADGLAACRWRGADGPRL
ncbi:MAG: biotin/lipoate--protein ligase family protein [Inquilinaceae bacterium]